MSAPTIEPTAFTTNQESESLSSIDGSGIGVLDDVPIIRPSASPTIEPTTNPTTMLPTPFFTATTIPIPEPTVPPVPVPPPVQAPVEVPPPVLSDVQVTSPPTEETSLAAIYDDDDDDDATSLRDRTLLLSSRPEASVDFVVLSTSMSMSTSSTNNWLCQDSKDGRVSSSMYLRMARSMISVPTRSSRSNRFGCLQWPTRAFLDIFSSRTTMMNVWSTPRDLYHSMLDTMSGR
mmetsp:Transcript_5874/g.14579  ORF Transcript_5874/g.14579 Transcript_5874/m.14579 type:complete len:233 (+) Transcript_5874:422-1120(+)